MYEPDINDATNFAELKEYVEKEFRKLSGTLLVGETDSTENRIWTELPPRPYDGLQAWLYYTISPVGVTGPHYYENGTWRFMGMGDFFLEISKGNVPGHTHINVDGFNPDVDTVAKEDIWDAGGTYIWSSTNDITDIVSNNAADTFEITVKGLDVNGNPVTQSKSLNGTTSVALDTPLWRVHDMDNFSSVDQVGTIQCGVGITTTSFATANIRAQMNPVNNKTLMAQFTIPAGLWGFATNIRSSISKSGSTDSAFIQPLTRTEGGVFRAISPIELSTGGTSYYQELFIPTASLPPLTDIKIQALSGGNNAGIQAGFDIILIEEQYVNL